MTSLQCARSTFHDNVRGTDTDGDRRKEGRAGEVEHVHTGTPFSYNSAWYGTPRSSRPPSLVCSLGGVLTNTVQDRGADRAVSSPLSIISVSSIQCFVHYVCAPAKSTFGLWLPGGGGSLTLARSKSNST